jgi:hypothetical protein
MTALSLAFKVAVAALLCGCCTIVLRHYWRRRLAADSIHLFHRCMPTACTPAPPLLPFKTDWLADIPALQRLARVSGLTLMEAEDLLDWLEQNGYEERSLECNSDKSFAVEFRTDLIHKASKSPHRPQPATLRRFSVG